MWTICENVATVISVDRPFSFQWQKQKQCSFWRIQYRPAKPSFAGAAAAAAQSRPLGSNLCDPVFPEEACEVSSAMRQQQQTIIVPSVCHEEVTASSSTAQTLTFLTLSLLLLAAINAAVSVFTVRAECLSMAILFVLIGCCYSWTRTLNTYCLFSISGVCLNFV